MVPLQTVGSKAPWKKQFCCDTSSHQEPLDLLQCGSASAEALQLLQAFSDPRAGAHVQEQERPQASWIEGNCRHRSLSSFKADSKRLESFYKLVVTWLGSL